MLWLVTALLLVGAAAALFLGGDANWIDSQGEWTYGRFVVRSIAYNVAQ